MPTGSKFKDDAKNICKNLFKSKNTENKKILMEIDLSRDSENYVDYMYKLDDKIYRIIVGKEKYVSTEGFSWIDKNILGDISNLNIEEKNGKCKLNKIAQGKTTEKYIDTKIGSEKTEFSFRYKIYLGGTMSHSNVKRRLNSYPPNAELDILKHFGYNVELLGHGGYGTIYKDLKGSKDGVTRVIKVCLGNELDVKKEWKGVNTAYKVFDKIKTPNFETRNLRSQFYQNENIVFNKNKAIGQLSEIKDYENTNGEYWYCISTSEFKNGGDASKVNPEDLNLFENNCVALWIELQAFAKDLLTGLSNFHKQGIAHLDVKYDNIFKTKNSGNSEGPKYKYAIADHTTVFNKNDFMNKLVRKYGDNYKDLKNEALKKRIWEEKYNDDIRSKLTVGTYAFSAPESPLKKMFDLKTVLPYDYDPCIADSYSAGVTILKYAQILVGKKTNMSDESILKELKNKDVNNLYAKFEKLINALKQEIWENRLTCIDALNNPFIKITIDLPRN